MRTMNQMISIMGVLFASVCLIGCRSEEGKNRAIRTSRLEIVNGQGDVRATLAAEAGGVALTMFDQEGHVSAVIEVKDDSPRDRALITFFDTAQKASATIGYPSFLISSASDVVWSNKDPMIAFLAGGGEVIWHAPPEIVGPWKDTKFIR